MATIRQRDVLRSMPALLALVLALIAAPQGSESIVDTGTERAGAAAGTAAGTAGTADATTAAGAAEPIALPDRRTTGPRVTATSRVLTVQHVAGPAASRAPPSTVA